MLTVELRINGALISHVYGRQVEGPDENGEHLYDCEIYRVESGEVRNVSVRHNRGDGLEALVTRILSA